MVRGRAADEAEFGGVDKDSVDQGWGRLNGFHFVEEGEGGCGVAAEEFARGAGSTVEGESFERRRSEGQVEFIGEQGFGFGAGDRIGWPRFHTRSTLFFGGGRARVRRGRG